MKKIIHTLAVLLAVVLLCTSLPVQITAEEVESDSILKEEVGQGDIVVLYTNDVHARAAKNMGYSSVSALRRHYLATGASVILLDAGDAFQGMPFASLDKGQSVVDCMNLVGYDVMTPGCQDFNYGTEQLLKLKASMKFNLICGNITKKDNGQALLDSYTILEKAGKRIGIFGLITPNVVYKTNPANIKDLAFQDPIVRAKEIVAKLQAEKVDYIIGLTSVGKEVAPKSTEIAAQVKGIDLIVDGHSHAPMGPGEKVNDTLVVSAGEYLKYVGVAIVKYGTVKANMVSSEQFSEKDSSVDDLILKINEKQDAILSQVIGKTSVRLNADREVIRARETEFGNMITDAMRELTGADIAVNNGGGICASIEIGDITKRNLITTFPYGNYVVTTKVTGQDIKDMLEHSVDGYPEPMQYFLQVSGMKFSFDSKKAVGSRVYGIYINGKKMNLKSTYILATNNFMKNGGDQYTMIADKSIIGEYDTLDEVLSAYIQANPNKVPKIEGRITEGVQKVVVKPSPSKKPVKSQMKKPEKKKEVKKSTSKKKVVKKSTLKKTTKKVYVVKKNDNLSKIAKTQLGSANKWAEIYKLNKRIISNPNRIYPGMKIYLPVK